MKWIYASLIVALFAAEIYATLVRHDETLSQIVWKTCESNPMLPLAVGMLMGHLFWRSR